MTSFLEVFTARRNSKTQKNLITTHAPKSSTERLQQERNDLDDGPPLLQAKEGGACFLSDEQASRLKVASCTTSRPLKCLPPVTRPPNNSEAAAFDCGEKVSVRLLIFIEDSDGTRSNIFDSSKYNGTRVSEQDACKDTASSPATVVSNNFNKDGLSSKLNNEMITRMVFGSFPMKVSNNTAIKVHSLKNSNKTMISNVFTYYSTRVLVDADQLQQQNQCSSCTALSLSRFEAAAAKAKVRVSTDEPPQPQDVVSEAAKSSRETETNQQVTRPINIANTKEQSDDQTAFGAVPKSSRAAAAAVAACSVESACSSLNSASTNLTNASSNFTCSSVPNYSSYITIYKRLMRSVSNSLISSNTAIQGSNTDVNDSSFESSSLNMNSLEFAIQQQQQQCSSSSPSQATTMLCEKCIQENGYPKYKIGVALIYCLPRVQTKVQLLSKNLTTAQTISTRHKPPPPPPPQTRQTHKDEEKQFTSKKSIIDPFVHFPSLHLASSSPNSSSSSSSGPSSAHSTPSPASPPQNSSYLLTNNTLLHSTQTADASSAEPSNEGFYEFFFSHLPLIEYQFKELREKIFTHLPIYFLNNPKYNKNAQYRQMHRLSVSSQQSATYSINSTSPSIYVNKNAAKSSSSLSSLTNNNATNISFTRLILREFEIYERKFNSLYSSPRLQTPAWLSLVSSIQDSPELMNNQLTETISNRLVNELEIVKNLILNGKDELEAAEESNFSVDSQKRGGVKRIFFENLKTNSFLGYAAAGTKENEEEEKREKERKKQEEMKCFLSTFLSTVLRLHLSWVQTVQPSQEPAKREVTEAAATADEQEQVESKRWRQKTSKQNKKRMDLRKQKANWTSVLERKNPYNPLWAQLSDLHGAVNTPLKLVRTVVVGKNRALVERILFLLSYFIRCGNSSYFDIVQENFDFKKLKDSQETGGISTPAWNERAVNVSELRFDPIVQMSNLLTNNEKANRNKTESNTFIKNASNSSAASPCGISSSSSSSVSSASSAPLTPPKSTVELHHQTVQKQRRLSSNSNGQNCNAQELPLIGCQVKANDFKSLRMQDNFGYSLLASYCDQFVFEFVLHGTSDRSFLPSLNQRLLFSKNNSILDCPISESIYIVIDADEFEVKVHSSEQAKEPEKEKPIGLVDSMIESVLNMIKLFQNSEFALIHLEDKLQELYSKSITLSQLKSQSSEIDDSLLMKLIELNDSNELEFLKQIVSALIIPQK